MKMLKTYLVIGMKVKIIKLNNEEIIGEVENIYFDKLNEVKSITINNNMPVVGGLSTSETLLLSEIKSILPF